jgi:octaprenyl-diphosphate synthase
VQQETPSLQEIYDPIRVDLDRVKEKIDRELTHDDAYVNGLLEHARKFRGKMIRPALLLSSASICGSQPEEIHIHLSSVIEILHHATLIHDDVLDEADIRRRVSTLNHTWGNEASVLFGDYLFARAYSLCAKIHHREANQIFSQTVEEICLGELTQTAAKFQFDLSEERYFEMIRLKTAVLFSTACRLGSMNTNAQAEIVENLSRFGEDFGIAFQIIDDALDLTGEEEELGKSLGTDLLKGKTTLPLIHLFRKISKQEKESLITLLQSKEEIKTKRTEIVSHLMEHDIHSEILSRAEDFISKAKRHLTPLPDSQGKTHLLSLANFALARRK